jgi:hypothetical protein
MENSSTILIEALQRKDAWNEALQKLDEVKVAKSEVS